MSRLRQPWADLRGATLQGLLFFAAIVLVTGVRFVDEDALAALHAEPFRAVPEMRAYLHASPLGVFVGHAVRADSPRRAQALSMTMTAAALGAVLLYGRSALAEPGQRWIFFRLVALSPLIHVLIFWVGKSDAFLVAAYMLLLVARQPVVVCGLSLVMTLAHPEQATVVLIAHLVLARPGRALVLAHLLGWAMGVGVWQAYLAELGLAGSPRVEWLANRMDLLVRANLFRPVTMLWLSFSWFWIPVLVHARRRPGWALPVLAAGCFTVAALAVDFTRTFTMLSLPLMVHVAHELARDDGGALRPWLRPLTVLAFLPMELAIGRVWDNAWTLRLFRSLAGRPGI